MRASVNIEEAIAKVVGRRQLGAASVKYGLDMQRSLDQLAPSKIPRGIYRFRSHKEADQWLMDHWTRKPAN
jgi:hypothetical protein